RRPHRGERRHREQDRDVLAGGPCRAPRHSVLCRRADVDDRSRNADRRRDPDRGARRLRADRALRGAQSRVRRHARGADHGDRDGARRSSAGGVVVKALVLAAGYATRLRPLTDTIPKPLFPVGGRPMVDWILDRIAETSVDEVHLVTNARFTADFERWAEGKDVHVHNDGTSSNEGRLGAIGDIAFVGLDDDLLVIASDNLFDYSLADYEQYW